jgi:uncharacterized repeat protein (TIGR01451 family)
MKIIIPSSLLMIFTLGIFYSNSAQAQMPPPKYTNQIFYDSCTYQGVYVIIDSSKYHSHIVEISYGDGTKDTGNAMANPLFLGTTIVANFIHHYSTLGTYTLKSVLLDSVFRRVDSNVIVATYPSCPSSFTGRMYLDQNANCVYDKWLGEPLLPKFTPIEVDSATYPIDTIYGFNTYSYVPKSIGVSYAFKLLDSVPHLKLTCPASGITSAVSTTKSVNPGDFGYSCDSSSGFDVAVFSTTHILPYYMLAEALVVNTTCDTSSGTSSGTISITLDPIYGAISSTDVLPIGATISGNTATWNYTGLASGAFKRFYVWGHLSAPLMPGFSVKTVAVAHPTIPDLDSTNNKVIVVDTTFSSFDPNEKQVSPKGNIEAGTTLTYTLSFENTGNAPATNVHILDTLSNSLDLSSFSVIASTHNLNIYKSKDMKTGRNVIKFDFPNINLLDSSHHGLCDGFVMYSIKTKSKLPSGTVINNRAGIYFDDNAVVQTNTTSNSIIDLSVPTPATHPDIFVYPNPSDGVITISSANANNKVIFVKVFDLLGRVIQQQQLTFTNNQSNLKINAPTGTYIVELQDSEGNVNRERLSIR